jgi:hypothetical protein
MSADGFHNFWMTFREEKKSQNKVSACFYEITLTRVCCGIRQAVSDLQNGSKKPPVALKIVSKAASDM